MSTFVLVLIAVLAIGFTTMHLRALIALRAARRALQAAPPTPTRDPQPSTVTSLRVISTHTPSCGACAHFDYELGQRELRSHPPMVAAMQHVPPWRMGHVMKTDAEGKHLPLSEQGIDKKMLRLEWTDMGACVEREELRAKTDACDRYLPRGEEIRA